MYIPPFISAQMADVKFFPLNMSHIAWFCILHRQLDICAWWKCKHHFAGRYLSQPLHFGKQVLFCFAGQLLLPACVSAPSALHRKSFRPLFQINLFPALDAVMSLNFINSGGLLIAKALLYDRLYYLLLNSGV